MIYKRTYNLQRIFCRFCFCLHICYFMQIHYLLYTTKCCIMSLVVKNLRLHIDKCEGNAVWIKYGTEELCG